MLNNGDDDKSFDFTYFLQGPAIDKAICKADMVAHQIALQGLLPDDDFLIAIRKLSKTEHLASMNATELAEYLAELFGPAIAAAVRMRTH